MKLPVANEGRREEWKNKNSLSHSISFTSSFLPEKVKTLLNMNILLLLFPAAIMRGLIGRENEERESKVGWI